MATGYSAMDVLNKNSKAGIDESPRARFRTKDISIFKMYRNTLNFYSIEDVEELAGDILMYGLKQNLELVYAPCEEGEYRIVAGERRWEALKYLVTKGYKEFEIATCKLTTPQDDDEEQVEIIVANAYRDKTVGDMIEEEQRLKASLECMRAAGKQIKGYDLTSGRLRDVIASMLRMSKTKVAQIEAVNNNLIPEFMEELNQNRLTFSAAYELSGMSSDEQREALTVLADTGELTYQTVKDMKDKRAAASQMEGKLRIDGTEAPISYHGEVIGEKEDDASDLDTSRNTGDSADNETKSAAGDEYQTPHPEGITSICYSCTEYETCNVKTGTCTSCDQYKNRKEEYKTDGQRYSQEQDAIDRETKRKLREQQDEERLASLPSDVGDGRKIHQIRLAAMYFDDVVSGKKPFELRKNDRGYKEGDIIEMMEFTDGKNTGRTVKALVTYMLQEYKGLEDGYCIMGIKIIGIMGVDMATGEKEKA